MVFVSVFFFFLDKHLIETIDVNENFNEYFVEIVTISHFSSLTLLNHQLKMCAHRSSSHKYMSRKCEYKMNTVQTANTKWEKREIKRRNISTFGWKNLLIVNELILVAWENVNRFIYERTSPHNTRIHFGFVMYLNHFILVVNRAKKKNEEEEEQSVWKPNFFWFLSKMRICWFRDGSLD